MEHSPSDANSHSASQEILHLFWKPKVDYRVYKSPASGPYPEADESSPQVCTLFP